MQRGVDKFDDCECNRSKEVLLGALTYPFGGLEYVLVGKAVQGLYQLNVFSQQMILDFYLPLRARNTGRNIEGTRIFEDAIGCLAP
jgi:hypothetical protein